jgi:hypothetical protein
MTTALDKADTKSTKMLEQPTITRSLYPYRVPLYASLRPTLQRYIASLGRRPGEPPGRRSQGVFGHLVRRIQIVSMLTVENHPLSPTTSKELSEGGSRLT